MNETEPNCRVAWITGAAGGLGQGLVAEFASQGWLVAAGCHRTLSSPVTERIWPMLLDVTSRYQVENARDRILERWGRIDALINNAGVTADELIFKISESDWDHVLDVNLKGAFLCSQAVLAPMIRQHSGQIINVASFAARCGATGQSNYAAAKAGLLGFTESLAREVGSDLVCVNAILPGVMPTPMTNKLTKAQLDRLASSNALGRLNSVAEVARFVAFLATMQNVSGQVFQLDSRMARWT